MSKTFKALLRAAHERAGKKRNDPPAKAPATPAPEIKKLDPPVSEERETPVRLERPEPPPIAKAPLASNQTEKEHGEKIFRATPQLPVGEPDPDLRNLLELELMVSANNGVLEIEGWLRGYLDRKLAKRLLDRYGLLHCLMQDERNWFWFWASSTNAEEMSERYGLPLDLEDSDKA